MPASATPCRLILTAPDTDIFSPWKTAMRQTAHSWKLGYAGSYDMITDAMMSGRPYHLPFSLSQYEADTVAGELRAAAITVDIVASGQ